MVVAEKMYGWKSKTIYNAIDSCVRPLVALSLVNFTYIFPSWNWATIIGPYCSYVKMAMVGAMNFGTQKVVSEKTEK